VALKSGDFINISSISCIVDYKGIPIFTNKDGKQFRVFTSTNGSLYCINKYNEKVYLSDKDCLKIEYIQQKKFNRLIEEGKNQLRIETTKKEKQKDNQ